MKVNELMNMLAAYNQDAEFEVIAHNRNQSFTVCYGDKEGCTKDNCKFVSLYLDELNQNEAAG